MRPCDVELDPADGGQHGAALLWALLFVVVSSGMVVAHAAYLASVRRDLDARYDRRTLAASVARSGLVEAVGWFQGQASQPVIEFAPRYEPFGDPPVFETVDARIGLVREFEIRGNLWARFEVRREEAEDVSLLRGQTSPGVAWLVGVRSYVYRIVDPGRPFDQRPNRVVAQSATSAELRSMSLALPAMAAVSVQDPAVVSIGANAAIDGGGRPGLAFGDGPSRDPTLGSSTEDLLLAAVPPIPAPVSSPDPVIDGAATLVGTPATLRLLTMAVDARKAFGVRLDELRAFADFLWVPGRNALPDDVRGAFVLVPGDATLGGLELRGAALVIDGDLDVPATSGVTTRIEGVVFVTGDARIAGDFQLVGALAVQGSLTLGDGTSPPVTVRYDQALVDRLRGSLRRYRMARGALPLAGL